MSLATRNVLIALCITIAIGASVIYSVNYLNSLRIKDLNSTQQKLSVDTLSLETQISLLESSPCSIISHTSELTSELDDLGKRLSYTESQLGSNDSQVILLKQQYSLLEIRDYLVTEKFSETCHTNQVTVLYFYSNDKNCADCDKAGYALSYLHDAYPNIRVYSFDYNLDLGALKTLISLEKVGSGLPAFVINNKVSYGFTDLDTLKTLFPKGTFATSTATTTGH
ncbi:MAG TPA: hypothetical protein VG984_00335 [Candidatus Paceibacterota bacterium]|nr:hypothetical protein [Candidatus Paceibacterota bacterium]